MAYEVVSVTPGAGEDIVTDNIVGVGKIQVIKVDVGGDGVSAPVASDVAGKVPTTAQGTAAHDAVDDGNPVKMGGKARTSEPAAVANGDRVDGYFDDRGRIAVTEPTRQNSATLALNTLNATAEVDLDGKRAMAFRLSSLTGSGATVSFEVQAPGSNLWFFCASFNIVNATTTKGADQVGSGLSNNFENGSNIDGVWIATGLGGFRKFRLRVDATGTGTATLNWSSTAAADYGFNHIFGDLQDDTPALAHWPVTIGGVSHTVVMPQVNGAAANWVNLPAPVSANNDRTTVALTRFREMRVLQSDHHLVDVINATGEEVRIPTEGSQGVAIDIRGTWNPGAGNYLAFEMSFDGLAWMPAIGFNVDILTGGLTGAFDTQSGTPGTANANGAWLLVLAQGAAYIRVIHTDLDGTPGAWSSGSATVTIRGCAAPPIQANFSFGDKQHGGTDGSSAPVKIGYRAIAHGSNPTAVAAGSRTNAYANRHGIPFMLGGHPGVFTAEYRATSAQTNDDIVGAIPAGSKLIVTSITVTVDNACSVDVGVRIGYGTASVPAEPADGAVASGVVLSHPGIAPGSGVSRGDGSGIIGIGADDQELRITCEVPTGGSVKVVTSGFLIES